MFHLNIQREKTSRIRGVYEIERHENRRFIGPTEAVAPLFVFGISLSEKLKQEDTSQFFNRSKTCFINREGPQTCYKRCS